MTTTIKLTDTQRLVLEHADPHEGRITWFPDNVKGGARMKVLAGLLSRELITFNGTDYFVALGGYDALGRTRPTPAPLTPAAKAKAPVSPTKANKGKKRAEGTKPVPHIRENSKQATVIALLQRPEGATITQVMEATGWQAHTVRGTFAGAFKKKLGLAITSDKPEGGMRVYRIA